MTFTPYALACLERAESAKLNTAPWHIGHIDEDGDSVSIDDADGCVVAHVYSRDCESLIVACREDVPALALALIETEARLNALLKKARMYGIDEDSADGK